MQDRYQRYSTNFSSHRYHSGHPKLATTWARELQLDNPTIGQVVRSHATSGHVHMPRSLLMYLRAVSRLIMLCADRDAAFTLHRRVGYDV